LVLKSAPRAPLHLLRIWEERMKGLFEPKQQAIVLEWLSTNWRRSRVVVVGSGFTLNAKRSRGTKVPLWSDLARAIESDLDVPRGKIDPLRLPDLHAAKYGSRTRLRRLLRDQLNNEKLRPGRAHDALWESQPAAVVTTNFLDTVLEKSRPKRSQAVVMDTDLGRPIERHMRHVIYLHGHLSDPNTWVAGRQEYEELPGKRPIIHAKVRQLLAEYPALVVGYSLTDPDFHLIYADTLRSMGDARPTGLALLPTLPGQKGEEKQAAIAEELNHGYWQTLGLSFVRFCREASGSPDDSYARFFKLTEQVTTLSQLLVALQKPSNREEIPRVFEQNVAVGRAALYDKESAEVLEGPDNRARWWRDVIARSLDDTTRAQATAASQATNLARHPSREFRDGEIKRNGKRRSTPATVLAERAWVHGSAAWRKSSAVTDLMKVLDGGDDSTRCAEQLLLAGASRVSLRTWIDSAMTDPQSVPRIVHRSQLAALALLTDGDRSLLRGVYRIAQARSEGGVCDAIEAYLGRAPAARRQKRSTEPVRRLEKAFVLRVDGDLERASKIYQSVHDELLAVDAGGQDLDKNLLLYFAAQGLLDCSTFHTDIPVIEELQRKRDALADEPGVRRWIRRTKALGAAAVKAKAQHDARKGHETTRMSWSASPGELWHQYERARTLGAPLSIRRELLLPLLGTLPSAEHELQERLAVHVKDTGEWLEAEFDAGSFSINRSAFRQEAPKLGAEQRMEASAAAARQLFPSRSDETPSSSSLSRVSRVLVLQQFPEIVRREDLPKTVRLLRSVASQPDSKADVVQAWVRVAHVCSWKQASAAFPDLLRRIATEHLLRRELLWGKALPWEHWSDCDRDFWKRGGIRLLRSLSRATEPVVTTQVGWLLRSLVGIAPRAEINRLCEHWVGSPTRNYNDRSVLLAAASILVAIPELNLRARRLTQAIRQHGTLDLWWILAERGGNTAIEKWGRSALDDWASRRGWSAKRTSRSVGPHDEITEARCLVSVVRRSVQHRKECTCRLLELVEVTWHVLPELGPILHPDYWGGNWERLLQQLSLGGHTRVAKTWLVARVQLTSEMLDVDGPIRENLMQSEELAFMRWVVIDGIAHGDSVLANNATYVLTKLARRTTSAVEVRVLASALTAAAEDIRVGVAHGAAFAAAYLVAIARYEAIDPHLVQTAKGLERQLRQDSLAVIHRQLEFGRVKGERHGRESGRPRS
jgi:hypothetical protein